MKLSDVTPILEIIAPPELAEDWDNVGLVAGDYQQPIRKIMLTIDLTKAVLAQAQNDKIDLLICYHPPIWQPMKQVVAGRGDSPLLYQAIHSGIALYALHTALDTVVGGINDELAKLVGITAPQPLRSQSADMEQMCKLVVFVPVNYLDRVSEAIFAAGAGNIGPEGKYTKCSFRVRGTGTFQGGAGSRPAIGKRGKFEQVEECRLETIVPKGLTKSAIEAMIAAHPYEEVAYDIYPLIAPPRSVGLGRFGELESPVTVSYLIQKIKRALKIKNVAVIGPAGGLVRRAAVGAGSCGSLLREVIVHRCDFYLTGELKHHHALELSEAGVTTVCAGHSHSERFILPRLAQQLRRECKNIKVLLSSKDRDPFNWY